MTAMRPPASPPPDDAADDSEAASEPPPPQAVSRTALATTARPDVRVRMRNMGSPRDSWLVSWDRLRCRGGAQLHARPHRGFGGCLVGGVGRTVLPHARGRGGGR